MAEVSHFASELSSVGLKYHSFSARQDSEKCPCKSCISQRAVGFPAVYAAASSRIMDLIQQVLPCIMCAHSPVPGPVGAVQ